MEQVVRKYSNFDEMKADEYRYWQSRPVHERMEANRGDDPNGLRAYKGWKLETDVPKTTKTFCPPSMPMELGISSLAATPSSSTHDRDSPKISTSG